jgi:isopentenyl diphosphate isomerase/L-lactate dehydrogenase-like FMN-dependent dehydrogenase
MQGLTKLGAGELLQMRVGGICRCGNQEIYRRLRLVPRVMRNVSDVKMETSMLGHKMAFPVYISAAAKGGLGHPDAEEALCRAAAAKSTIQMCPHMSTKTLQQMATARAPGQVQFLQLYVEKDRAASKATVQQANELGFSGLFLTVRLLPTAAAAVRHRPLPRRICCCSHHMTALRAAACSEP